MNSLVRKWMFPALAGGLVVAGLVYAFWPQPVPVDISFVDRGALTVTVEDEGETRVRENYLVSAPLPGRVLRFDGDVGDPVQAGVTPLATIRPSDPAFLDQRTRSELEAAVKAAEAGRTQTAAELAKLEAAFDFAEAEYMRAKPLAEQGTISQSRLDRALMEMRTQAASVQTATANLAVRDFELERARAALLDPGAPASTPPDTCCFIVTAPVSGRILRILHESESVVTAGTPLIEIGDPADLEIVADLLSTDAVQASEGDAVIIDDWGGGRPLNGVVKRVEPFGFTKVSTLGIEEQRVNVVIDITDPHDDWQRLGHGYRVDVRIVIWHAEDVLLVPLSAIFRQGQDWAVYVVEDGYATMKRIEVGRMNTHLVEVLGGLQEDNAIILHPGDRVTDGTPVTSRDAL